MADGGIYQALLEDTGAVLRQAREGLKPQPVVEEVGAVRSIGKGIVRLSGLSHTRSEEVLEFAGDLRGMAFNLDPGEIGAILFGDAESLRSGDRVRRTGRVLDVPVGADLLGRVVDPLGRPLDRGGPLRGAEHWPVERPAPGIMERAPVTVPLLTGVKVVDALIPVGRGQRELILGDRQTGKTTLAVDTIINQRDSEVCCVYCAVGQRSSSVARVVALLEEEGALEFTTVMVAEADAPPGLQYIAPYAATSVAEYFMGQGRDVLVVYDDLTQHARAYRELSLLLRRPPGREAFPGDIFYIHSRLLERATHLRGEGGGSLTALPIIETEAQNISAYIPTNLISITDGQIYLSPDLFRKGMLPAVDVGKSVSRVGGKTQLPAYRAVAGDLRLAYSQFEELEAFARFGTRLDEDTRATLARGRRVRATLQQDASSPMSPAQQLVVLHAVNRGVFDPLPEDEIGAAEADLGGAIPRIEELADRIERGEKLDSEDLDALEEFAREVLADRLAAAQGEGDRDT